MEQFELYARNISMEFPGVRTLDKVSLRIRAGEIRAVAGANGAGKSTLMKVLSGVYPSYTGDIFFNGKQCFFKSPLEAKRLGIHTVFQEVDAALFPDFTVYENLLLEDLVQETGTHRFAGKPFAGTEKTLNKRAGSGAAFYNRKALRKQATDILAGLDIDLDLCAQVKTLPLAQKQLLLIAREVHKKCSVLILDEPTAALGEKETQKLFQLVKRLAETQHTAILFITHRIAEILSICDCCSVMSAGKITDEFPITKETKVEEVAQKMLGKHTAVFLGHESLRQAQQEPPETDSRVLLQAEGLCDRAGKVKDVSFAVKRGEIIGLAGLVGAGKTELCRLLFGAEKRSSGKMRLNGKNLAVKNPSDAVKHKIALIPEERRKEGIFPMEHIAFNLSAACLEKFCTGVFFQKREMERSGRKTIKELNIACRDEKQQIIYLSGGNQQKTVIGKWLQADCDIYIFDEPMQGIDAGAKKEILQFVFQLAQKGAAVIYASSDIPEILAVADRIYVMYDGRITKEFKAGEAEEKEIMYAAVGGTYER